jgi:hypothetical protein
MRAITAVALHRLRASWRAWAALVLLTGLAGGAAGWPSWPSARTAKDAGWPAAMNNDRKLGICYLTEHVGRHRGAQ